MLKTTFWEAILVIATSLVQLPDHFRCPSVVLTPIFFATHNEDPGKLNIQKVEKKFQLDHLDDSRASTFFGGRGGEKSLYMVKVIYQRFHVSIQGFLWYLCHFMGFFFRLLTTTHPRGPHRRDSSPSFFSANERGTLESTRLPWLSPSLRRIANHRLQRHLRAWIQLLPAKEVFVCSEVVGVGVGPVGRLGQYK